jgi:transposase
MMPGMRSLTANDLQGLTPEAVTVLAQQMLQHIEQQAHEIELKEQLIQRQARDIVWRDAKLEKVNFELARLKRWRFGARTEAMDAQQRQMFEDTMVEDEASLEAQLVALRAAMPETPASPKAPPRRPRRQALPEHLKRVEHRHEPEDTHCPTPGCGRAMTRVGEDVSEKLDIIPAEFFVHRHVYGKWVCRCCERLVQEPSEPEIIDGGMPASGLVAHTLISHFVDHLPYYRLETINARSRVHTPRSTLASWSGQAGAALEPLYEAHKRFVLGCAVLHADETPVAMLDPGAGKTKKAYIWAYARGALDAQRGVVYDFCLGRGAQYPQAFLDGTSDPPAGPHGDKPRPWQGTLVCDQYAGYARALDPKAYPQRQAAACAAQYPECRFMWSRPPPQARLLSCSSRCELRIIPAILPVVGGLKAGGDSASSAAHAVQRRGIHRRTGVAYRLLACLPAASSGGMFLRAPWQLFANDSIGSTCGPLVLPSRPSYVQSAA